MNQNYNVNDDIESVLVDEAEIDRLVKEVAAQIDADYPDCNRRLLLLCILKGSVVFMGDLMRAIKRPVEIDFMKVSSYGRSSVSSGTVNIILDLYRKDMSELDIIVIEDIIDSGRTLSYLTRYLEFRGAKSVRTCTLLDKPSRRVVDFTPDYMGLEIPDEFVVGYGLDYAEKYRALPYVGVLKPEVYSK
jgi:hypoxanthine phosphoribosyltransferase